MQFHQWRGGVVLATTAQLHSTKPDLGFARVQTLLLACRRFWMVMISDNGPGGNKTKHLSSVNHTTKTIHHHHHYHQQQQQTKRKCHWHKRTMKNKQPPEKS